MIFHPRSLLVGLATLFTAQLLHATTPRTPAAELESFTLADTNLVAELVASEPNVASPVAIAWDRRGRLFVAEMRDYPNDSRGGAIRLLEDRDRDGVYESSTLFASRLSFPNSVFPFHDGLLVTCAPDLIFLRDTDGDGQADQRRIIFTGFSPGNQQLRANGLVLGVDGWIYGANGRSDGLVRPGPGHEELFTSPRANRTSSAEAAPQPPVSLRGRDFRFHAITGRFESLAGRSQFGLALDPWGNRFLSWNTLPARHEVFNDAALAHLTLPGVPSVLADLSPAGDIGEIHPRSPAPTVFNNESSSHFNALAGLTCYLGHGLGPEYTGNLFMGETLRNLVHRRVLEPAGATFIARRGEQGTEFLASSDPWFHPVNFATGPEGALYVVDFYRNLVEHPDFVPRELRDTKDWRHGHEHGRIWRIRSRSQTLPSPAAIAMSFSKGNPAASIASTNPWVRITAQRLLLESIGGDPSARLRRICRGDHPPEAKALALHLLSAFGTWSSADWLGLARSVHARVREQAARLGAAAASAHRTTRTHQDVLRELAALMQDTDERVALHATLAVASLNTPPHPWTTLLKARAEQAEDPWQRLAALSGLGHLSPRELEPLLPKPAIAHLPAPIPAQSDPNRKRVLEEFQPALRLKGDRTRGAVHAIKLCLPCHVVQGQGQRVGPDLSGAASKPAEVLLTDILDPNQQVPGDYRAYTVVPREGEPITGLIVGETATRVVVRHPGGADTSIARTSIAEIQSSGKSLMPEGLEAGLTPQDLADILAFIRSPTPQGTPPR